MTTIVSSHLRSYRAGPAREALPRMAFDRPLREFADTGDELFARFRLLGGDGT